MALLTIDHVDRQLGTTARHVRIDQVEPDAWAATRRTVKP